MLLVYSKIKIPFWALALLIILMALFTGCGKFDASANVDKQLDLAVKYLSENKFEEAVLAYREVIKIDKKNVPAYKGLGVAYALQGKPEQAEQALQEGLKQVSDCNPLKLTLAGLLADQNKKDQAEAIYNEIISKDGKYLPAYQAYAKLLVTLNRQKDAVALLEKASSANAGQYKIYAFLAEQYFNNGNKEKALSAISQSLSAEPNQADAYRLLEGLYSNRWTELNELGEQYIQQGKILPGQIIKLTGLYQLGKYNDMLKIYEQLANELKDSPKLRLLVAQAYTKLGQKEQGISLGKDVIVENIKDTALLAEIASFYLEAGDKVAARGLALKGISLDDTVLDNYIVLSRSYQDEDKSKADIWMTKYLLNTSFSIIESKKEQERYLKNDGLPIIIPEPKQNSAPQDNPLSEISALQTAQSYFKSKGIKVGKTAGQYVINVENIWKNKAVLKAGMYCSENEFEIGICQHVDGRLEIAYVDHIYAGIELSSSDYMGGNPRDINDICSVVSAKGGFKIANKPDCWKIGFKSGDNQRVVVLLAPYGEHWQWAYTLQKTNGSWSVISTEVANEEPFAF